MVSRSEQFHVVTAEALSHLALTQFMAGREGVCVDLAGQALSLCDTDPMVPARPRRARAERGAAARRPAVGPVAGPRKPAAPTTWCRRRRTTWPGGSGTGSSSRGWPWSSGAVSDAVHYLELPFEMPALPPHLEVSLLVERALHRPHDGQPRRPARVRGRPRRRSTPTASATGREGALADLDGDLRRAADLTSGEPVRTARRSRPRGPGPGGRSPAARVPRRPRLRAHELLLEAVTATESRRNALPLPRLEPPRHPGRAAARRTQPAATASAWGEELRDAFAERPGVTRSSGRSSPRRASSAASSSPR